MPQEAQVGNIVEIFPPATATASTTLRGDFWKQDETKFLLDRYEGYLNSVGPKKKFRNKKAMWCSISQKLKENLNTERTYEQVNM